MNFLKKLIFKLESFIANKAIKYKATYYERNLKIYKTNKFLEKLAISEKEALKARKNPGFFTYDNTKTGYFQIKLLNLCDKIEIRFKIKYLYKNLAKYYYEEKK